MLKLAADEDFNNRIVRGLVRRAPYIDLKRVQDAGLLSADDPSVLAWAADESRVLLTHDVTTMKKHAFARISARLPMPGVFEIAQDLSIGVAIDEILLVVECRIEGEWEAQVRFLPLR